MKKLLFILFIFIAAATFGQPYTYHLRYDTVKFTTANNSEFVLRSSTRDSTNGILINIGGGITQFKRIRAISATQFTVGTDTITITGSGGGGGGSGTVTNIATGYGLLGGPITTTGTLVVDTATLGPLWRSQISIPNLIIQPAGTGQNAYYVSGDSLYFKKHFNTYGLTWTNGSDSSMLATIDSTKYVPKEVTSQITGAKTFTQDVTVQKNGAVPYFIVNRMGTTGNENIGGIQYKDNATIRMYSFLANFADTGWTLTQGNGGATKSWKTEDKFGHMSLGFSTFTRGWAVDVSHSTNNYGADSALVNGMLRYRWINAGGNLIDSFKIDRGANLVSSGNITAEIDSTGTGTAINMVYQGVDKKLYRAALPSGGSSYTFSNGVFESAGAVKGDSALFTTRAWHQKGIDSAVALIVGGGGITAAQVKTYVRNPMYNIAAGLGSAVLYTTLGRDLADATATVALTDAQMRFFAIYINETTTITGVKWLQIAQGDYTADQNNVIGLYSYSAGTLTQRAVTTNDGNLWKGTASTMASKAFASTYSAAPGVYFIGILYNTSAQTTAPSLAGYGITVGGANLADFTNSAKLVSFLGAQTNLPTPTQAMSGLTSTTSTVYFGLY